jgi:hypothetical protein
MSTFWFAFRSTGPRCPGERIVFIPRDELRQLLVDESVEVKVVHPEYVAENTVVIRHVRFHGYVGEEEIEIEIRRHRRKESGIRLLIDGPDHPLQRHGVGRIGVGLGVERRWNGGRRILRKIGAEKFKMVAAAGDTRPVARNVIVFVAGALVEDACQKSRVRVLDQQVNADILPIHIKGRMDLT